jgi:hypothetical protein
MIQVKKEKQKCGRKKLYNEETTTLSIVVPKSQYKYLKSVLQAMLKPMQIK